MLKDYHYPVYLDKKKTKNWVMPNFRWS